MITLLQYIYFYLVCNFHCHEGHGSSFTAHLTVEFFFLRKIFMFNPYPTAFPYGNGMVLHFYQQQESSTTKTVHKVINRGLKTYV